MTGEDSLEKGSWSFIVVAGGSGVRLGGQAKQFRLLGGRPMWEWSARIAEELFENGYIEKLVVVFPKNAMPESGNSLLPGFSVPCEFTAGGTTRSESVYNGLRACSTRYAMIHDAARPFVDAATCVALIDATTAECGAVPLLRSTDSLKKMENDIVSPFDRKLIFRTQTPQAFNVEALKKILKENPDGATDEAELWLNAGMKLASVDGNEKNFKVTNDFDWRVATSMFFVPCEYRTGHGFDVHPLAPGRALILGGVNVPSPLGLDGHSDADVISHAVSDALLGAAGEPDIGTLFPASDMAYKDANSYELLQNVLNRVESLDWDVEWIDITLHAQTPKLAKNIPDIVSHLSRLFEKTDKNRKRINLKVKSGEHIGSVGRGDCMICYAVATLRREGKR